MSSDSISSKIAEAAAKFPKPEGKVFQYGTAGVRPLPHHRELAKHTNPSSFVWMRKST
jgi:hypothetical protein